MPRRTRSSAAVLEVVNSTWAALDERDRTALTPAAPSLRRLADRLHYAHARDTGKKRGL